jgi:poly-gamma-glutamate capsule biosynthesis protein CapA/YwtB (metallophosphatase superfamily)
MKQLLFILSLFLSLHSLPQKPTPPELTFAVGGDMLFDRRITFVYSADNLYQVLSPLKEKVFNNVNAAIVNLEGPVSAGTPSANNDPGRMVFNFPPQSVSALGFLGINAVSLANNHTSNAGLEGLTTTRKLLQEAGITPIGGPLAGDVYKIATFSGTRLNLVVIGVNTFSHPPDISNLIKQIKIDPRNRVLIFPHWGVEYMLQQSKYQQQLAYSWIDAGADIIIGSHPHVIQPTEVYKNRPIIYSLGNLLFDQTFSDATQLGLVVNGTFTSRGLRLSAVPIKAVKYQPTLMTGQERDNVLRRFYEPLSGFVVDTSADQAAFFPD